MSAPITPLERAVTEEREACAKIAESFKWWEQDDCAPGDVPEAIARLIRGRPRQWSDMYNIDEEIL